MARLARDADYRFRILDAVEKVNAAQKRRLVDKMVDVLGALDGRRIAVWGLSFKPRTDDMRDAPSITIIDALLAAGPRSPPTIPRRTSRPGGFSRRASAWRPTATTR